MGREEVTLWINTPFTKLVLGLVSEFYDRRWINCLSFYSAIVRSSVTIGRCAFTFLLRPSHSSLLRLLHDHQSVFIIAAHACDQLWSRRAKR